MTRDEKLEIAAIVREIVAEQTQGCSLGIKRETAHELISFADTWKNTRRAMIWGLAGVAVTGLASALVIGIRTIFSR